MFISDQKSTKNFKGVTLTIFIVCFAVGAKNWHEHVELCSQIHQDQLNEFSIPLLIVLSTFIQFQLKFFGTRQIVLHSVKRMRIERYQLFLQLHDMALIDLVEQWLHLLPNLMREVNSTKMKLNLPRDVGHDDPYSLILLAINNQLFLVICWTWNHNLYTLPSSISLQWCFHIWCPYYIIWSVQNNKISLQSHIPYL